MSNFIVTQNMDWFLSESKNKLQIFRFRAISSNYIFVNITFFNVPIKISYNYVRLILIYGPGILYMT